jgi:hypothetical protein
LPVRACTAHEADDHEIEGRMTITLTESFTIDELREKLGIYVRATYATETDRYPYVSDVDLDDGWFAYCVGDKYFKLQWSRDGDELTVSGTPTAVEREVSFKPATSTTTVTTEEAELTGDVIELVEATVRRDGTVPIKLIAPGWSKNERYYPASVLESDGPSAFPAGTHMYWDHPSASEAADRPERSLRDLSAVTVGDARWEENGVKGAGLYADAKVMAEYQPALEQLAPHIGVSIRAGGNTTYGEADGKSGELVERITVGKSIDFVTTPAAGGEIVSLFEAVRSGAPRPRNPKEPTVAELQEVQRELTEAQRQLAEATALGTWAAAERDQLLVANTKLQEGNLLTEATRVVTEALDRSDLPDITKKRLVKEIAGNPPLAESGELDKVALAKRFDESVKVAREEIAALTGSGRVVGLGESVHDPFATGEQLTEGDAKAQEAALVESFKNMGLSDDQAKAAAAGR